MLLQARRGERRGEEGGHQDEAAPQLVEADWGPPGPDERPGSRDPGCLLVVVPGDLTSCLSSSLATDHSGSEAGAAPQVDLQPRPQEVRPEHGELEAEDGCLEAVLVLDDREVPELLRLGQVPVDEPGEVGGGVAAVRGAVQPESLAQPVEAGARPQPWDPGPRTGQGHHLQLLALGDRVEQRGLGRHLAPVAARRGEVDLPEEDTVRVRLRFLHRQAGQAERGDPLFSVPGDVTEELVAVLVPLDTVQLLPLHVVLAVQAGHLPQYHLLRHQHLHHPHTGAPASIENKHHNTFFSGGGVVFCPSINFYKLFFVLLFYLDLFFFIFFIKMVTEWHSDWVTEWLTTQNSG